MEEPHFEDVRSAAASLCADIDNKIDDGAKDDAPVPHNVDPRAPAAVDQTVNNTADFDGSEVDVSDSSVHTRLWRALLAYRMIASGGPSASDAAGWIFEDRTGKEYVVPRCRRNSRTFKWLTNKLRVIATGMAHSSRQP